MAFRVKRLLKTHLGKLLFLSTWCWSLAISLAAAEDQPPYSLVTGDNYFPFASSSALKGGWSQAIVVAVFNQMKHPIEIESLPWQRGYQWALEGQYIGTFPYVHSKARANEFYFSEPINTVPVRIYVAAKSDITDLPSLNKKSLCLPYGYVMDSWSERFFADYEFTISRAKNAIGCANKVLKRWSDFGFINGYFTEPQLKARFGSSDEVRILQEEVGQIPLHFIVSKKIPSAEVIIKQFNQALNELDQNGQKSQIDQAYLDWLNGLGPTPRQ
ncbi:substrate-binding periplasmic protein [Aliiglaciecola litoralis]|uniref:Solute-binding protein family 3/N-terminal domain-containing protein n=1 Tax=Aliiglaciecola litoralis TaxID=582857 RepID=A0ABN1LFD3_9ALTE